MDSGLVRFVKSGIRFAFDKAAATSVGFKLLVSPATSFDFLLPTALPGTTQAVTVSSTGQIAFQAISGGGGTVTSLAIATPSDLVVTNSPITTAGTITISRASQTQNTVLAAPFGANGVPVYRLLDATDIPALTPAKITGFDTQVRTSRLDQFAAPTAAVNLNSQKITGLADPTNAQDAVTKIYADALIATGNNKGTARAASTTNITLATPGAAMDGVTLAATNIVLLKDQATASQNGLYVWSGASTPLTRITSTDTSAEVKAGLFVFVSEGTANGNNGYTLTTDDPIVLDTTALVFAQTSGAGQIVAGSGLTKTGNQVDVIGTTNRITANADSIDIAATYAGQTSITTLGTIATGAWNGAAIPLAFGGTGATTAAAARTALGVPAPFRQSFTNANLTSGLLTVTHNLGQQIVQVQVSDENNKIIFGVDDITLNSSTTCTIDLTFAGTIVGTWNVVVVG